MKRLFSLAVALIIGLTSLAQTPTNLYIRGDTINLRRDGRNAVTLIDSSALISKYLQVGGPKNLANTYKNNSHLVLGDSATTKGLIIPRVQTTAAITDPRQGMIVYSISDSKFYYRTLTDWVEPGGGGGDGEVAIHETVASLKVAAINESGAIVLGVGNTVTGEYEYDIESSATGDDYLVVDPAPSGTGRYLKIFRGGKVRALELKIVADGTNQKPQIDIAAALSTVQEILFNESNTTTAINGKVTLPAGKAIRFEGNAILGGDGGSNDTLDLNGSIIIADRLKQIFATNLVVINAGNGELYVKWFGAIADNVTDNLPFFNKAFAAAKFYAKVIVAANMPFDEHGSTYGYYMFSDWLIISKNLQLEGEGENKSMLLFPNSGGIKITLDGTGATVRWLGITGFLGAASPVYNSNVKHGILLEGAATVEYNKVKAFPGDGIAVIATTPGSNANLSTIRYNHLIYNGRHGVYTQGADANSCDVYGNNSELNARWAYFGEDFLGNVWTRNHAASNADWSITFQTSQTAHNGYNYFALENNGGNRVSHGGTRYLSILDDVAQLNINHEPPNATYWSVVGAGGVDATYTAWNATAEYPSQGAVEPGVTTGWQDWWRKSSINAVDETWSATGRYLSGGGFKWSGASQVGGVSIGDYVEGDNIVYNNSPTLILGGAAAGGGLQVNAIGVSQGWITLYNARVLNGYTQNAYTGIDALSSGQNRLVWSNAITGGSFAFQGDATLLRLMTNGSDAAVNSFWMSGNHGDPSYIGRSAMPAGGAASFVDGIWMGAYTNWRMLGLASALPSTTTSSIGDMYLYNGSDTMIIKYQCVDSAGTDTWITVRKGIDGIGTDGRVTFWNSANSISSSDDFLWNNTSKQLTISSVVNDMLTLNFSGTGRGGIMVNSLNSNGQANFYFQNDRGSFGTYGGLVTGGSTHSGDLFGVSRADRTLLFSDGATSTGLIVGTLTPDALQFGTDNVIRGWFSAAGVFNLQNIPAYGSAATTYLTSNTGDVSSRTVAQVLADIAATPTARTLTINGTTQDLSANRTYTVDGVFTTTTFATTNATPTNVITYGTATNERGVIEVTLTGVKSNGDGITGKKIVAYKNIAGTLTLGTITEDLATVADGDLSTAVWTISVSGTNVIVVFTGIAATVIDGTTSHKITKVIPAS